MMRSSLWLFLVFHLTLVTQVAAQEKVQAFVPSNPSTVDPSGLKKYSSAALQVSALDQEWRKFAQEKRKIRCSFLVLNNLSRAAMAVESPETLDCINTWIAFFQNLDTVRNKGNLLPAASFQTTYAINQKATGCPLQQQFTK